MKRAFVPLLVALGLLAIAAAGWWLKRPPESLNVACVDPVAGCVFSHAGRPARLRFSVTPVPLQAFELTVDAPGARRISAEFQMVGMDMGFNRYPLRPARGVFSADITLPICISGRHDWRAFLTIDGERYMFPFQSG
ncbi:MAG: hypothetical protein LDL16_10475 [Thiobacillus sp.]|nr:hypothetical protein [Thiobacillus sp.]